MRFQLKGGVRKSILIYFMLAVVVFGLERGRYVPLEDQISIFKGIRDIAAIVFGVFGAWLAIAFPDAIDAISRRKDARQPKYDVERVRAILLPMVYSSLILAVSFLMPMIIAIVSTYSIGDIYVDVIKRISFSVNLTLVVLMFYLTLKAVVLAFLFLRRVRDAAAAKSSINALRGTKSGGRGDG